MVDGDTGKWFPKGAGLLCELMCLGHFFWDIPLYLKFILSAIQFFSSNPYFHGILILVYIVLLTKMLFRSIMS